jgi:hypothetical protein
MAFSLVASVTAGPSSGGGATAAINTTGATLLVISASWYGNGNPAVSFSDSKGNTYTLATLQASGTANNMRQQFAYCLSPIVGTSHTFTVSGGSAFPAIIAYAFSGMAAFQIQSGAGGNVASLATGSVTPSSNGALVLTGIVWNNSVLPGSIAVAPSGFAITTKEGVASTCFPGAAAYVVQATAAAINPTWSWTGTLEAAASTIVVTEVPTTARVTQDAIEILSLPAAAGRVTQDVIEILGGTVSALVAARVSQDVIELLYENLPTSARVTQAVVETLVPVSGEGHVTQFVVEVFAPHLVSTHVTQFALEVFTPHFVAARLTQMPVEAWNGRSAALRVTQELVEIFLTTPPCVSGDFPIDTVTPGGSCPTPPPAARLKR